MIQAAAERMVAAANQMEATVERFERALREHADRLEALRG
jgi:hypothetical protein